MKTEIRQGPLQALVRFYERMPDAEEPGWSQEKFGWSIVLNKAGNVVDVKDLRNHDGKKPFDTLMKVPAAVKRTAGISPNFLWDKSAYVLGRTAGAGKRTAQEHAAFVQENLEKIGETQDEGLLAFKAFLQSWSPARFDAAPFTPDMLDANIMFELDGDRKRLHERPAAKKLVAELAQAGGSEPEESFCLVTGQHCAPARLHPVVKGVQGAQTAGAALVSFNNDAFTSYGKAQGENAPTSELAAFQYGTALNRMLQKGSRNRLSRPIGDATLVFWADAADAKVAEEADELGCHLLAVENLDETESRKIGDALESIARGRRPDEVWPFLTEGVRFHVLGLAPNAARVSVRFWLSDSFGAFVRNIALHYQDMALEPAPWRKLPSPALLLAKTTAMQEKFENIPAHLAGDLMQAILSGGFYPRTWLSATIMRLRAGDNPENGWHAAAIRAVLQRKKRKTNPSLSEKESIPVSLNRDYPNVGYQLGRLFAVYELAQKGALGGLNTTMRDKYFGAASATPASIFPVIIRNGQNHLAALRKKLPGWAILIEKELEEIFDRIQPAEPLSFPRSLPLEQQGEFALGYYQQRKAKLAGQKDGQALPEQGVEEEEDNA